MEIGRIRGETLGVCVADGTQCLLARQAGGRRPKHLERPAHAALDRGDEELLLGAEEAEDVGLGDPDGLRDRLRRTPDQPPGSELDQGRFEDLLAPFLGALSLCDCHGEEVSY